MSLYQAYGVGRIREYDSFIQATDYVIPSSEIEPLQKSVEGLTRFPTILDYLRKFSIRELKFAIPSRFGRVYKYTHTYKDGDNVLAVEVSVDDYPHVFLSQHLKRLIRRQVESIVRHHRDYGWVSPMVDTRTNVYELPKLKQRGFQIEALYQDYCLYEGRWVSDFITSKSAIALFPEDSYSYKVIGTFDECGPIHQYFKRNFSQKVLPFPKSTALYSGYYLEDKIMSVLIQTERGWKAFVTKEGYRILKGRGCSILRADKRYEDDEWENLDIQVEPEVIK